MTRLRSWIAAQVCFVTLCVALPAHGEDMSAPPAVQAQILARLMPFDRNFGNRVKGDVVILLLIKNDNADSVSAVGQIKKALSDIGKIGGHPLRIITTPLARPSALPELCASHRAHAVYVSPGFRDEAGAIGMALRGSGILTFAGVEEYVRRGITVGVSIVAGRPTMSINLAQSRSQRIDFAASVLALARIY